MGLNERVIAEINGEEKGYEIIIISGMHGNENSTVTAIENVINNIVESNIPVKGNISAFKGNVEALKKKERYLDQDLNRLWTNKYLKNGSDFSIHETKELHELNSCIENKISDNYKNSILIDLHTFSSQSQIFAIPSDNQLSIELARQFRIPYIEDLTLALKGTAIQYFATKGVTSIAFEGGMHNTFDSIKNLEAIIYIALHHIGAISEKFLPELNTLKGSLNKATLGTLHHYKLLYHHKIINGHTFQMQPGFINFERVEKGDLLAYENEQPIYSDWDGFMLMPLYQKLGEDGFYIVDQCI